MLITAEIQFGTRPDGDGFWVRWAPHPREGGQPALVLLPADRFAEYVIHGHWTRIDEPREVPVGISESPLHARVNGGRWIVQCPVCNSAQIASEGDPRFFCVECLNVLQGKQWRRVIWPKERKQIEDLLNARPLPQNRNWEPQETVEHLARENADHQVAA